MPPMVIAAGVMAAATTASNIYSTKKAAGVNEKAIAAQERSEREDRALADRQRQAMVELERQRQADYVRANEPYWQTGQRAYQSMLGLAGLDNASMPAPAMPTTSGPPTASAGPVAARRGPTAGAPPPPSMLDMASGVGGGAPSRGRAAYRVTAMPAGQPVTSSLLNLMQMAAMAGGGKPSFDAGTRALLPGHANV